MRRVWTSPADRPGTKRRPASKLGRLRSSLREFVPKKPTPTSPLNPRSTKPRIPREKIGRIRRGTRNHPRLRREGWKTNSGAKGRETKRGWFCRARSVGRIIFRSFFPILFFDFEFPYGWRLARGRALSRSCGSHLLGLTPFDRALSLNCDRSDMLRYENEKKIRKNRWKFGWIDHFFI